MSQQPPQHPGGAPDGSEQPTESVDPAGGTTGGAPGQGTDDQPTQAFGQAGAEQPTQSFDQPGAAFPSGQTPAGPAYGGPPAAGDYGQGQPQGGYPQQGGYAQQGGYPQQGGAYPPPGPGSPGHGGPDEEPKRRSPVPIIIGAVVALLVIAGLVFAGLSLFGGDDEPVAGDTETAPETGPPVDTDDPAGTDEGDGPETMGETDGDTGTEDDDGQTGEGADAEQPSGQLYDTLTEFASAVEGEQASWQIDEPGWTNYEVSGIDPVEAYSATFTSDEDESLEMWAVRLTDADEAAEWAESLVEERGEADETGDVWVIENEDDVEDDLEYGVFHLWEDGENLEVLWWDDMGVVRHVSGPAETTWDFYMYLPL